jgi:hypothetical protein
MDDICQKNKSLRSPNLSKREYLCCLLLRRDPNLVVSWLESQGLPSSSIRVYEFSWVIEVTTTTDQASKLLGLRLSKFVHRSTGAVVFRSLDRYQLPQHVAEQIEFIAGVNNFPRLGMLQKFIIC